MTLTRLPIKDTVMKLCRYVHNVKLLVQTEIQTIRTTRSENIKYSKIAKKYQKIPEGTKIPNT